MLDKSHRLLNGELVCNTCSDLSAPLPTQSAGLSKRLSQLVSGGRRLNDDSFASEGTLNEAMCDVVAYSRELFAGIDATVEHTKSCSLYECQEYFHACGGPAPNPANKGVYMKPDGGILFAILGEAERIPILIVEDKVQGTNDILYSENKKRQATGNAIERGAKNIRGAEMLFASQEIFPYVLFASGCDFHHSETISKRIEMMNMGVANHYVEIAPATTEAETSEKMADICRIININKVCGKGVASVFVKAHKWDAMSHGSSSWKKEEIAEICKRVVLTVYHHLSRRVRV